jgi:hypothetical protein
MNRVLFLFLLFFSIFFFAIEANSYTLDDVQAIIKLKQRINLISNFIEKETGKKPPFKFDVLGEIKNDADVIKVRMKLRDKDLLNNFLDELNLNLKLLEPYRKKAETIWNKKVLQHADKIEEGYLPDNRTKVKTKRIGVILDKSGSMEKFLPKLRNHIHKNFKSAIITQNMGCLLLIPNNNAEWFFVTNLSKSVNPFQKDFFPKSLPGLLHENIWDRWLWSTYSLFSLHIKYYKVDTIYWFCDLKDRYSQEAINSLGKLIKTNKVKLYVHVQSRSRLPKPVLKMIKDSGGKLIVKKL